MTLVEFRATCATYLELGKVRLTAMALLTTGVGFLMGSAHPIGGLRLVDTLLGTALVGVGANALNQWMEREADARMVRTQSRPLPQGRLQPIEALTFGILTSILGIIVLALRVNSLAAWLGVLTLVTYVGVYTPLKRRTSLCTLVGAVPGAMPPLIGWAAARGTLDPVAWVLFGILFLWQLPHFLAIAWMYQEDYARAGFKMLPVVEPDGGSTARQMILYGLGLLVVSLLPTVVGSTGLMYFVGVFAVGVWFLVVTILTAQARTQEAARRLFMASLRYLPMVLFLMLIDRRAL